METLPLEQTVIPHLDARKQTPTLVAMMVHSTESRYVKESHSRIGVLSINFRQYVLKCYGFSYSSSPKL